MASVRRWQEEVTSVHAARTVTSEYKPKKFFDKSKRGSRQIHDYSGNFKMIQ